MYMQKADILAYKAGKMIEKVNIDEVIAKNPNVDKEQLVQVLKILGKVLKKLQDIGVKRAEYNLVPPFSRKVTSNKKN